MRIAEPNSRDEPAKPESPLWAPQRRHFTGGMVLIVTLAAFETTALSTALPTIVRELRAESWYSWPFTVFMVSSAISTVLSGRASDRRGPAAPLLLAMPVFALGLLLAGFAPSMPVLLVARVLQGLGAGGQIVPLYVMVSRVYPEQHRPAAFGILSAAWVLPALLGPAITGTLTQYLSWRWAFLGLAPLVALGAVLVAPTIRRVGAASGAGESTRRAPPLAALGAALGVVGMESASRNSAPASLLLGLGAFAVFVVSLRMLLPAGTLLGRRGIPVMVLARGLLPGAFFGAQAFIPLTLSVVHHWPPAVAGVPLTAGSLGWALGAYGQSKQRRYRWETLVAAGFGLVACGLAGLVASSAGAAWSVIVIWFVAGTGMGLGMNSTAVRVLALSPGEQQGFHSAALQVAGLLGQAVAVGLGGVLVNALATAESPTAGVVPLDLALMCLAVLMAFVVFRSDRGAATSA